MPTKHKITSEQGKDEFFKEWKSGKLKSGSGQSVPTTPEGQKQAVAIYLSKKRKAKKRRSERGDSKYLEGAYLSRFVPSNVSSAYSEGMLDVIHTDAKKRVKVMNPKVKGGYYYRMQEVDERYSTVPKSNGISPALAIGLGITGLAAIGGGAYLATQSGGQSPSSSRSVKLKNQQSSPPKAPTGLGGGIGVGQKNQEYSSQDDNPFKKNLKRIAEEERKEAEDYKVAKKRISQFVDDVVDYAAIGVQQEIDRNNYNWQSATREEEKAHYAKQEETRSKRTESFDRVLSFTESNEPGKSESFYGAVRNARSQFDENESDNFDKASRVWEEESGTTSEALKKRIKEKYPNFSDEDIEKTVREAQFTLGTAGFSIDGDLRSLFNIYNTRLNIRQTFRDLDGKWEDLFNEVKARFFGGGRRSSSTSVDWASTLGVGRNATDKEVKTAFRNLAKQYHPDLNPNNPDATTKMQEIIAAYEAWERRPRSDSYANGWETILRFDAKQRIRVNDPRVKGGHYYRMQEVSDKPKSTPRIRATRLSKPKSAKTSKTIPIGALIAGGVATGAIAGAASAAFAMNWGTSKSVSSQVGNARKEAEKQSNEAEQKIREAAQREKEQEVESLKKDYDQRVEEAATTTKQRLEQEFSQREEQVKREMQAEGDRRVEEAIRNSRQQLEQEFSARETATRQQLENEATEREARARQQTAEELERSFSQRQAETQRTATEVATATTRQQMEADFAQREAEIRRTVESTVRQQVEDQFAPQLAKLREDLEASIGEVDRIKKRSSDRIKGLEGELQQVKSERDRTIETRVREQVDPALREFDARRQEMEAEHRLKQEELETSFIRRRQEIESTIEQRAKTLAAETIDRINREKIEEVTKEREKAIRAAQRDVKKKAEEMELEAIARGTPAGELIVNDDTGVEFAASARRGFAVSPTNPKWKDDLRKRFDAAAEAITNRFRANAIDGLQPDFRKRMAEIAGGPGRTTQKWQAANAAHLRQTNRENAVNGAVDSVQERYKAQQRKLLDEFMIRAEATYQAEGRRPNSKAITKLVDSLDADLKRLHKSMMKEMDRAVVDAREGQPLNDYLLGQPKRDSSAYLDGMRSVLRR